MSDDIRRQRTGRPANEDLKALGLLRTSPKCKICQSPHKNEITQLILEGVSGEEIRRRFNKTEHFQKNPLNAVNIHSHKKHCDPEALAKVDHQNKLRKKARYDPVVNDLYQHQYNTTLDKLKTVEQMYRQRLLNLGEIQLELEGFKSIPIEERATMDNAKIRELTGDVNEILHGLTQDMLKHQKIEEGSPKQINVVFINNFKSGVEKFIDAFVNVLVTELDDSVTRERIKEKFITELDNTVSPLLDEKAIEAEYTIVHNVINNNKLLGK